MAKSYGEAQRRYYQKKKDTIYRKTREYKIQYNKEYYAKNKEGILARRLHRDSLKKVTEST